MISNTDRHRAVFLAMLMILSVFAGTLAFSGSVVAASDPETDDGSITNTTVVETSNNIHSIELNATLNTTNNTNVDYIVSLSNSDNFDLSNAGNSTVQLSDTSTAASVTGTSFDDADDNFTVTVDTSGGGGADDAQVNLSFDLIGVKAPSVGSDQTYPVDFSLDNNTDGTIESQTEIDTLTVQSTPAGGPELLDAVHYEDTDDEGAGVELSFSEPVKIPDSSDVTLYDEDGNTVGATLEPSASSGTLDGRYFLDTSGTILTEDVEVELSSDISDADGNSLPDSDTGNNSVTVAPVTVKLNDDKTIYEGSNVAIVNNNRDISVEMEGPNNFFFDGSTDTNSEVFVFNTSDRDLGEYNVSIDGSAIENTQFTLRDLGLDVSIDDTNVSDEDLIEGDASAVASGRSVDVDLLDSDGDSLNTTPTSLDGQGEVDFEFNALTADDGEQLETGTYTVEVTDTASGVTVESSDITVNQAADEEADFADGVINDERGDIIEMTVETTETDTATVVIGNPDQGITANATVEDDDGDDQVTLYANTYNFQDSNDNIFSLDSDSDDEITSQDQGSAALNELLDAGDYDLDVRAGSDPTADSDDVASLTLSERGTETLRSWTAPDSFSASDLEDINEGLADGEITQSNDISNGDLVIHQLVTTGFEGPLSAQDNEDVTDAFFSNRIHQGGFYNLTIEEANPGANQDAEEVRLDSNNATVIADGDNDTYFVIVDTDAVTFKDNDQIGDDTALEANFTVQNNDDSGVDYVSEDSLDSDEDEETLDEYDVVEPDISVDEPFNVSQASGQTISGETTLAPTTELTLRVRSQDGTSPSFLKTAEPDVQSDGTFSATFDFSEQNVGDEYDITVDGGDASEVSEEGTVVESVATDTATPEPDTDTATPEPDTDTATPEPDTDTPGEQDTQTSMPTDTPTSTPTSTPGFGVIVALTALLAAALLAVRRES